MKWFGDKRQDGMIIEEKFNFNSVVFDSFWSLFVGA